MEARAECWLHVQSCRMHAQHNNADCWLHVCVRVRFAPFYVAYTSLAAANLACLSTQGHSLQAGWCRLLLLWLLLPWVEVGYKLLIQHFPPFYLVYPRCCMVLMNTAFRRAETAVCYASWTSPWRAVVLCMSRTVRIANWRTGAHEHCQCVLVMTCTGRP